MMYINIADSKISTALDHHYKGLIDEIFSRIDRLDPVYKNFFDREINPHLDIILKGSPSELLICHERIEFYLHNRLLKEQVKKVFQYEGWFDLKKKTKYDAYSLAENLDIPTCVYCNRMYTKTVSKRGKITRPSFDHWFSKSTHPLLSLSFFNLIPSCNVCNSGVKGQEPFGLLTHFHPYYKPSVAGEQIKFRFSFDHLDYTTFKFKIISSNANSKRSVEAFKLSEIYETHEDEITDLRRLRDLYSPAYLEMLKKNILPGVPDEEIYRLAFSTHLDEANFNRRPLSKMKKDILTELGITK